MICEKVITTDAVMDTLVECYFVMVNKVTGIIPFL